MLEFGRVAPRRDQLRATICGIILSTLSGAGCASFDEAQVRDSMAGTSATEIRRCLGTPDDFALSDDAEYLVYSRARGQRAEVSFDQYSLQYSPMRGTFRSCDFLFRVGTNGIDGIGVRGRTESGLNDDRYCLNLLRRCLAGP